MLAEVQAVGAQVAALVQAGVSAAVLALVGVPVQAGRVLVPVLAWVVVPTEPGSVLRRRHQRQP